MKRNSFRAAVHRAAALLIFPIAGAAGLAYATKTKRNKQKNYGS
jgi:hypothetical protein